MNQPIPGGGAPIGIACFACGPARESSISGAYNPWQNDFVIAKQQDVFGAPSTNLAIPDSNQGWRAFTMAPMRTLYRMQVDVRPLGTILYAAGAPVPSANEINGGLPYCPTRVRVSWNEPPFLQYVDIDVGPGITFSLPPTNQVYVDWLVPNPATNGGQQVPSDFDPNATRFATTITAKAAAVQSPTPVRPTVSQTYFVSGVLAAAGPGHQALLPRGARSVQIFSTPAFGNAAVPAATDTVARFVQEYVRLGFNDAVPAPFSTFPTQEIPFQDAFTTERVIVPPGYNAIRINADPTAPDVRRNVTIVVELDI